jgi:hypothetical protein
MTRLHDSNHRFILRCAIGIALSACSGLEPPGEAAGDGGDDTATTEQHGMTMQGMTMQGMTMQGMTMQGMTMQGMRLDGATLGGDSLTNVRVEHGEVVAERDGTTLRGTALVGAHFFADVHNTSVTPTATAKPEYRVTKIALEDPDYDPTETGQTYVYTLEQRIAETSGWAPACLPDSDGRRIAIPLAATWDDHGDRVVSPGRFTFGCTTGVIAKCYRWGYRPWLTGYGADMAAMHWTCTRLARADYCGNGITHTHEGTWVNVWDKLPAPGPIQHHGLLPPVGMLFEAGWNTGGAVCLSHARWLLDDGAALAALCPDRLVPPGLLGTVCDTVSDALSYDGGARLFNEAYLNL